MAGGQSGSKVFAIVIALQIALKPSGSVVDVHCGAPNHSSRLIANGAGERRAILS